MENDQVYIFRISIDVRNFRALRKLPLPVASIYVKVTLPTQVVELAAESTSKQLGANVAALTAPLRTHPPVDIARQTEMALTNGFVALELPATIMAMATALARGAKLIAEVCHRDRYTADRLLGVGTVPMAALLEEPWLDGYVPILANKKVRSGSATERVLIGSLRVVLVIEELGLAIGPGKVKRRSEAAIRPEVPPSVAEELPWPGKEEALELPEYAESLYAPESEEKREQVSAPPKNHSKSPRQRDDAHPSEHEGASLAPPLESQGEQNRTIPPAAEGNGNVAAERSRGGTSGEVERQAGLEDIQNEKLERGGQTDRGMELAAKAQQEGRPEFEALREVLAIEAKTDAGERADPTANEDKESLGTRTPASIRGGREYEAAWELEVWKRNEEARFMAELAERETVRMTALEQEWKKRERESVAEAEALRAEHAALVSKLREQLASLEHRERKLVLAEEAASKRREALEREHAQRTADVKVAIKRLKEECEHQLKLERSRYEELAKQKRGLEERLSSTEAARSKLEREFSDFRTAQRCTPEAELMAQVVVLQQRNLELQRGAERATTAKKQYKAQVLRMARELAALHKQQAAEEAARLAEERRRLEARALASTAREEADRAREEQTELLALKQQLARLQEQEQASAAATVAALRALSVDKVVSSDEKERSKAAHRSKRRSAQQGKAKHREGPSKEEINGADPLEAAEAAVCRHGSIEPHSEADPPAERPPTTTSSRRNNEEDTKSTEEDNASREDVVRLLRERAALLRTGVYRRGDKVILSLEKEIQKRSCDFKAPFD